MTRAEAAVIARAAKLKKQPSLHDRFWNKVSIKSEDECWEWTAATRRGYGAFWYEGRHQPASRMVWFFENGEIDNGLVVCHTCDNPPCCNPKHLFLGTGKDNNDDKVRKKRHGFGEKNGNSKLTEEAVLEIKKLKPAVTKANNKELKAALAKKFNVTTGTISDVWTRGWKHINEATL